MRVVWVSLWALAACTTTSVAPTPSFEPQPPVRLAATRLVDPGADTRPVPDAPNVVLVMLGSSRADQLPPWGGPAKTGPVLARWAKTGITARTTVAASPSGKAAAATILTGLSPYGVGLVTPAGTPDTLALDPDLTTLAEHLHGAGFSTIGVTANPYLNVVWGLDQGFEVYLEAPLRQASVEQSANVTSADVVARLLHEAKQRNDPGRPLYLQASLVDAHDPIEVSEEALAAHQGEGVSRRLARYRAALGQQDAALGALIDGLASQGITPSNTLFVVVGDHGESLGDGLVAPRGHGDELGPDVAIVPWILFGKGVQPGVIEGITTHADVLPTTLSLAGLPVPDGLAGEGALASMVRNGGGTAARSFAAITTSDAPSPRTAIYTATMMCQVDHDPRATARAAVRLPFAAGCCAWTQDRECAKPEWEAELLESARAWRAEQVRAGEGRAAVQAAVNPAEQQQLQLFGDVE